MNVFLYFQRLLIIKTLSEVYKIINRMWYGMKFDTLLFNTLFSILLINKIVELSVCTKTATSFSYCTYCVFYQRLQTFLLFP